MDIASHNAEKVQKLLKYTYGLVPIVAGLDKFTNLLVDWKTYLGPAMTEMIPFSPSTFMMIVGVIEIVAGIIVLIKPHIGAIIVMIWLLAIAAVLIFGAHSYDVAVRDFVMSIGAFSLSRLSAPAVHYSRDTYAQAVKKPA